jgi:hypothetical protein
MVGDGHRDLKVRRRIGGNDSNRPSGRIERLKRTSHYRPEEIVARLSEAGVPLGGKNVPQRLPTTR